MYSFPNSQSAVLCLGLNLFLTCIQVSKEAGKVIWHFSLLRNFPQISVIHTVKGFSVANITVVDVFSGIPLFWYDPTDELAIWSLVPLPFYIQLEYMEVHILLNPHLEDFEHYFASMWDKYNCVAVWTFFGITFLWDWNENWLFPFLWPLLNFPNLPAYIEENFHIIIF